LLSPDYLKYCVKYALEVCAEDLDFFEKNPFGEAGSRTMLQHVLADPFITNHIISERSCIANLPRTPHRYLTIATSPSTGPHVHPSHFRSPRCRQLRRRHLRGKRSLGNGPSHGNVYFCKTIYRKPTILTNYPKEIKAFYMKLGPDE